MRPTCPAPLSPVTSRLRRGTSCLGLLATLAVVPAAFAQQPVSATPGLDTPPPSPLVVARLEVVPVPDTTSTESSSSLPEAPGTASATPDFVAAGTSATGTLGLDETNAGKKYPRVANAHDMTISPGQTAPKQTIRDKMVGSVIDAVSPYSFGGYIISGSYTHLTNGSPNFGAGIAAYGQRVGSATARGVSQNLFYEGATASIFHEDPRYYVMGSGHPFFKRLFYAGTRPLITRTDGGRSTPNLALLTGYLGAAALTKVYYPPLNQGFNQTLQTYGGSIGGAAIGYVVSEFLSDTLQIVHLKKGE